MTGTGTIISPSQNELRALWESGVPLDDAWMEFTPDNFDRIMLMALQSHPDDDRLGERSGDERVRKRYEEMKGWLPRTFEGRQAKLRNKIEVQRSYLLDNLYNGQLWAIGFRTLADGFDELARVPRHLFFAGYEGERYVQPSINWTKGELTTPDSYFDIHIVRSPTARENSAEPSSRKEDKPPIESAPSSTRVGRRNTRDEIREKAEFLLKNDVAFQALPNRPAQAEELRARLKGEEARHRHEMLGYKTSVIVRIIGQVANRLGASEQTE
jgi:hypothetical protein